jgi:hypothetical protein
MTAVEAARRQLGRIEPLARAVGLKPRARIAAGGRWFVRLEGSR